MLICQVAVLIIIFAIIVSFYFLKAKNNTDGLFYKVLSLLLATVFFFRFMLGGDALKGVVGLLGSPINGQFFTALSIILNWVNYTIILLVILYPFFKNSKFTFLIKYYCLIVGIINVCFIYYLTKGIVGVEAYSGFNIRAMLMAVELAIILSFSFAVFMENNKFKIKKSDLYALLYILPMMFAVIPSYALMALFGNYPSGMIVKNLSYLHRLILYGAILIPFCIYLAMRKRDMKYIKLVLLFISLGALINFSETHRFADFLSLNSLPIHLCHTAMYIIPICIIFKLEKVFYFTYFINVLGAFIALLIPSYGDSANFFSASVSGFFINHYLAFFMPILMVMLGVYSRPKFKHFKYAMIGFGIYFTSVLILNAWFSNYASASVDYFFTNSDFVAEKIGKWAENLRDVVATFSIGKLKFTFYPIYQAVFFLVYIGLGAGVWFLYEAMYNLEDTLIDISIRKKRIKSDQLALEAALDGRSKGEPMNQSAGIKLKLNNFSKRYGRSRAYAVKSASLEINGGEIFGFLGHNGAGKSTIIKSVVGIQPITSGSIEVCGYDVDKQSVQSKMQIGYVPDHYALYEKLTGRQYINYIADLFQVSLEDRNTAINKYVKLFELTDAIDNQIKTYSHGMKQKITIISALVHNPKIWILDEPLTGLDPHSIFQVKECMKLHAKEGNIVFFSSHIIDVVENICDRVAIIKKGQIITVQNVKDILKSSTLEEFYLKKTNN